MARQAGMGALSQGLPGANAAVTFVNGVMFFTLLFFLVGLVLSAALWAVGALGDNDEQTVNGEKGFLYCAGAALGVGALFFLVSWSYGGTTGRWLPMVAIVLTLSAAAAPLLWLLWRYSRRPARPLPLRVTPVLLTAAGVLLPGDRRRTWSDETWDIYTEVRADGRHAAGYLVDAIVKLPVLAWQFRAATVRRRLIAGLDAVIGSGVVMYGAAGTVVAAALGYVFAREGLAGVIGNLDNLVALSVSFGFAIGRLQKWWAKRRSSPSSDRPP